MATFTVEPGYSVQMENQPLSDFTSGFYTVNYSDLARFEITSNVSANNLLTVGSFSYSDSNPTNDEFPTSGTISTVPPDLAIYETDHTDTILWSLDGANIDVLQFLSRLNANDGLGFFSLLLTGHDRIIGADGPDHLYGFGGSDTVFGGAGDDRLFATGGNNQLFGGPGNDQLHGGPGNNTLAGGSGADQFWFDTALKPGPNVDKITDFTPSQHDKIVLSETDFPRLGPHGTLHAAHFHINHAGPGASPQIVYTPGNGFLYYDANGHHPGGMTHFATLSTHPVIHNTDFLVVA